MTSLSSVDTGAVFKEPVQCLSCDEAFYFTLRKIAEAQKLPCPQCRSDIDLADPAYESLVTNAKQMIALIDQSSRRLQPSNARPLTTQTKTQRGAEL